MNATVISLGFGTRLDTGGTATLGFGTGGTAPIPPPVAEAEHPGGGRLYARPSSPKLRNEDEDLLIIGAFVTQYLAQL